MIWEKVCRDQETWNQKLVENQKCIFDLEVCEKRLGTTRVFFFDAHTLLARVHKKIQGEEYPFTVWYVTRNLHVQKTTFVGGSKAEDEVENLVNAIARHEVEGDIDWKEGVIILEHASSVISPDEAHQP